MATSLPANPSLENLKKQAKALQKAWQAGSPPTLARIRAVHPQYSGLSDQQLGAVNARLAGCQLVLAREAGFHSWAQMKVAVQAANRKMADEFVELACLCYDDPHYDHRSFHARAHQMLREQPWLSEVNIWCSAASGNAGAVRMFLDGDPDLVNRPGPHGWAPLLCACYSRVQPVDPEHSTFNVAKLLLDRGADPNAYTLKGNADDRLDQTPRRFTALTGVFGGGSTGLANQPPHPHWRELAELLLARGAHPADEQSLKINQDASLEILLRHGLKPDAGGPDGISLMGRALSQAARRGTVGQVRMLLAQHARTDEKVQGKTPWEHAIRFGNLEVAGMLEEAGAPVSELDETARFVSLCMAGDERGARGMLANAPDLFTRAPRDMVHRAVSTRRTEAVRLVVDLGFDPNYQDDNPAITEAGALAENEEIVRILLAHGASLTLRDPWYDSTGIGWANFFHYHDLRDRLLTEPKICIFDALDFDRLDRVPDILAADPEALERPFAKCLSRPARAEDSQTPLLRMVLAGKTQAVLVLLELGANVSVRNADGLSLLQIAREHGFAEIAGLLQAQGLAE